MDFLATLKIREERSHMERDIGINKINEEGKSQAICRGRDKADKPTTARKTTGETYMNSYQWLAVSNVQYTLHK